MKNNINSIKFNLTYEMAQKLIEFNELKKKLINLKNKKVLTKEESIELNEMTNNLNKLKVSFIKSFRLSNEDEILEYLKIKENN